MPKKEPTIIFETKKYKWTRTGKCNRCGQCCIDEGCPHFAWVDGVATCLIYDTRDQDCPLCSQDRWIEQQDGTRIKKMRNHKVCIDFPNHPFLNCLKHGKCGYKFTKVKK